MGDAINQIFVAIIVAALLIGAVQIVFSVVKVLDAMAVAKREQAEAYREVARAIRTGAKSFAALAQQPKGHGGGDEHR